MKLLENEFLFHASFLASLLSNPNLNKFTTIQPAPLQNLKSSKVAPWKFVRKLRSFVLMKCQNNFYVEFFEVVQQNRLYFGTSLLIFWGVAARMIAPPFILNFHILPFRMAKDNHEGPAFGIFLKRQRS